MTIWRFQGWLNIIQYNHVSIHSSIYWVLSTAWESRHVEITKLVCACSTKLSRPNLFHLTPWTDGYLAFRRLAKRNRMMLMWANAMYWILSAGWAHRHVETTKLVCACSDKLSRPNLLHLTRRTDDNSAFPRLVQHNVSGQGVKGHLLNFYQPGEKVDI